MTEQERLFAMAAKEDGCEVAIGDPYKAAMDCAIQELTRLRAENAQAKAKLDGLAAKFVRMSDLACEMRSYVKDADLDDEGANPSEWQRWKICTSNITDLGTAAEIAILAEHDAAKDAEIRRLEDLIMAWNSMDIPSRERLQSEAGAIANRRSQ